MDPVRGVCIGCYRTLEEIGGWAGLSDEERERVFGVLEKRKRESPSNVAKTAVPPLA